MAATNFTPIQLYFSTTASAVPLAANLAQGELAINIADGKLYYEDSSGVVQVIATKGAGTIGGSNTQIQYNNAGALAGNAAMTFNSGTSTTTLTTLNLTNALGAIYGGTAQSTYAQGDFLYASASNTLSKLGIGANTYILTSTGSVPQWSAPSSIIVQTATNLAGGLAGSVPYQSALDTTTFLAIGAANRVMTSTGSAPQWVTSLTGLTGVSSSSITNTSLTSGRVVVSTTAGLQADDADLTFDGTTLSAGGFSTTGLSTLVKTVTVGNSSFNGTAVFAAATPAKLYMGTGTVTDVTSAISATNAIGAIASLGITPIAATNTSVTYTNAATLYIAGAPSAGTNVTLTNPYALYVAAGDAYFGGTVTAGTVNLTTLDLTNLEVTNIKAKDGTASITLADSTGIATFSKATVISTTDNTNAALRITQLGTGNALLVEDTTNPDASPFVIDASGNVIVGTTASITNGVVATTPVFQEHGLTNNSSSIGLTNWSSTAARTPSVNFNRSAGNAVGTRVGITTAGTAIGTLSFSGDDGTNWFEAARIEGLLDATGGTSDMPGRLVFSTTADGASTVTERMRIDSSGNVGIGTTTPAGLLQVQSNLAGNNQLLLTNIASSNSGAGSEIVFTQGASGYAAGKIQCDREGSYSATASSQDSALVFFTATDGVDAEKLRITSAGSVGIGTSSPSGNLEISNAGNAVLRITAGNTSSSIIQLGDTDDGNVGEITYSHSTNSMAFDTNDVERMRIDSSGNLGIGTASPRSTLNVVGDITLGATPGAAVAGTAYAITGNSGASGNAAGGNLTINAGGGSGVTANGDLTLRAGQTVSPLSSTTGGNVIIESGKPSNGGTSGYIAFNSYTGNPSAAVERMRIAVGGQILFGNSTENLSRWGRALFDYPSSTSNPTIALRNSTTRASGNKYGILFADSTDETNAAVYVEQNGSGNNAADLLFGTNAGTGGTTFSAVTERMRITAAGSLLVGGTTTLASGKLVVGDNTTNTPLVVRGALGVDGTYATNIALYPWNTTENNLIQASVSLTGVSSGFRFKASDGGGATTSTTVLDLTRTQTIFYTGGTERAKIDSSGNLLVTNAAGLGYGTGAGGTVTQATNKATGVTLNKPTGQITMNNAALAAGATVSFTFSNSLVSATDMLLMTVSNGTSYLVQNYAVSAGVAQVRVTNITGGSLSEAAVLNFAIIKGATS